MDKLFGVGGARYPGTHLNIHEIRDLIHFSLLGPSNSNCKPKWCRVDNCEKIKKVVLILVGYVSGQDYHKHKDVFGNINKYFSEVSTKTVFQPSSSENCHLKF